MNFFLPFKLNNGVGEKLYVANATRYWRFISRAKENKYHMYGDLPQRDPLLFADRRPQGDAAIDVLVSPCTSTTSGFTSFTSRIPNNTRAVMS